jgi:prevent-host-death family protein
MQVALHHFKASLSRYVAQAAAGEVLVITSHDKPVAQLTRVPPPAPMGLQALLDSGAASGGGGKPTFCAPVELPPHGQLMSDAVLEDRR